MIECAPVITGTFPLLHPHIPTSGRLKHDRCACNPVCWKQDENTSYLSLRPCAGPDCRRLSMLGRLQTETALRLRSRSQSPAGADDPGGKDRPDDATRAERT